jgi:hypothetical protein
VPRHQNGKSRLGLVLGVLAQQGQIIILHFREHIYASTRKVTTFCTGQWKTPKGFTG